MSVEWNMKYLENSVKILPCKNYFLTPTYSDFFEQMIVILLIETYTVMDSKT
jgi:hypothetical protein